MTRTSTTTGARLEHRTEADGVVTRREAARVELAQDRVVHATQAELAVRIGSAREVITRRLDSFHRAGWVQTDRGTVRILDEAALQAAANVS